MSKEIDSMKAGQAAANMLFDALREADAAMTDDTEKVFWWAGFFGSLGGFSAACIGPGAIKAIANMTTDTTQKVLDKTAH